MKGIKKTTTTNPSTNKTEPTVTTNFVFSKDNYKWMFIGIAFLVAGYLLMIGGGSENPNVFNEEMFNFQRLTLSPLLLIAGFIIEIYAIMKKPSEK